MNICINAFSALRGGGQTYLINLLKEAKGKEHRILLLVSERNIDVFSGFSGENITICLIESASSSIFHRVFWEIFKLPGFLKCNRIDRYYAPGGIMVTPMPRGVLSITALRNMLPFDSNERKRFSLFSYNRYKLLVLKFIFLISYKISDRVVFISNTSRDVIKEVIPRIDSKSTVIPHGINQSFYNNNGEIDARLMPGDFYLYVSILDVYKCQKEVVMAWKEIIKKGVSSPLVLIGPKYNEYGNEVIRLIKEHGMENDVIYLGKVNYEKIGAYYKSAKCLIFASSCECCPNILLEKLASGKTVLCSNVPPMPEFGADAVIYFDPYDINDIVEKVAYVDSNESLLEEYSKRSLIRSKNYDWENTIDETIRYITK